MVFFSQIVATIKRRSFGGMQAKTEQLDPSTRQSLQEFLEDVPVEREELQKLQKEIEEAHERLAKLQERESFVGTRLASYQRQLDAIPTPKPEHVNALQEIAKSHDSILRGISILEERIEKMESRQHSLQYKTEECQVVLETAETLQAIKQEQEQEEQEQQQEDQETTNVQVEMTTTPKQTNNDSELDEKEGLVSKVEISRGSSSEEEQAEQRGSHPSGTVE
jgi:chromosome segregation ATPase